MCRPLVAAVVVVHVVVVFKMYNALVVEVVEVLVVVVPAKKNISKARWPILLIFHV